MPYLFANIGTGNAFVTKFKPLFIYECVLPLEPEAVAAHREALGKGETVETCLPCTFGTHGYEACPRIAPRD